MPSAHIAIDPATTPADRVYKLLVGSVVPRPIAWVSSVSGAGAVNLAPFSFFTVVSRDPPMVAIAVGRHDEQDVRGRPQKDTALNIRATGDFVVNVVSVPLGRHMAQTARVSPREVDEFVDAGVTPTASELVRPPRVAEAAVNMECVLETVVRPGSDEVLIGRVVRFHIRDELLTGTGRIDIAQLDPLGRLAGAYATVRHTIELPTPGPLGSSGLDNP